MSTLRIFRTFCLVAFASLLFNSCVSGDDDEAQERVNLGDRVPSFTAKNLDGSSAPFTLADFEGKNTILVLFTTTCPHCREVMPVVDQAWQEIDGDERYQIIAVAREGTRQAVEDLWNLASPSMAMPCYLDPDRSVFNKFASMSVPRFYHVGEQGKITWKRTGEAGITKDFLLEKLGFGE